MDSYKIKQKDINSIYKWDYSNIATNFKENIYTSDNLLKMKSTIYIIEFNEIFFL